MLIVPAPEKTPVAAIVPPPSTSVSLPKRNVPASTPNATTPAFKAMLPCHRFVPLMLRSEPVLPNCCKPAEAAPVVIDGAKP